LDVIGIHEWQERVKGVAGVDTERLADAKDALAGGLAAGGLYLVAPERPIFLPSSRNVGFLETRLSQHVDPILDVHSLLLERKRVISLLLGLIVVEERCLGGIPREFRLPRLDDRGKILRPAFESPLSGTSAIQT